MLIRREKCFDRHVGLVVDCADQPSMHFSLQFNSSRRTDTVKGQTHAQSNGKGIGYQPKGGRRQGLGLEWQRELLPQDSLIGRIRAHAAEIRENLSWSLRLIVQGN